MANPCDCAEYQRMLRRAREDARRPIPRSVYEDDSDLEEFERLERQFATPPPITGPRPSRIPTASTRQPSVEQLGIRPFRDPGLWTGPAEFRPICPREREMPQRAPYPGAPHRPGLRQPPPPAARPASAPPTARAPSPTYAPQPPAPQRLQVPQHGHPRHLQVPQYGHPELPPMRRPSRIPLPTQPAGFRPGPAPPGSGRRRTPSAPPAPRRTTFVRGAPAPQPSRSAGDIPARVSRQRPAVGAQDRTIVLAQPTVHDLVQLELSGHVNRLGVEVAQYPEVYGNVRPLNLDITPADHTPEYSELTLNSYSMPSASPNRTFDVTHARHHTTPPHQMANRTYDVGAHATPHMTPPQQMATPHMTPQQMATPRSAHHTPQYLEYTLGDYGAVPAPSPNRTYDIGAATPHYMTPPQPMADRTYNVGAPATPHATPPQQLIRPRSAGPPAAPRRTRMLPPRQRLGFPEAVEDGSVGGAPSATHVSSRSSRVSFSPADEWQQGFDSFLRDMPPDHTYESPPPRTPSMGRTDASYTTPPQPVPRPRSAGEVGPPAAQRFRRTQGRPSARQRLDFPCDTCADAVEAGAVSGAPSTPAPPFGADWYRGRGRDHYDTFVEDMSFTGVPISTPNSPWRDPEESYDSFEGGVDQIYAVDSTHQQPAPRMSHTDESYVTPPRQPHARPSSATPPFGPDWYQGRSRDHYETFVDDLSFTGISTPNSTWRDPEESYESFEGGVDQIYAVDSTQQPPSPRTPRSHQDTRVGHCPYR